MKAHSDKSKQSSKATHRVLAGVLCGASVLSLVLSLVMPPISQAIANDAQAAPTEEPVMGGGSSSESTDVDNTTNGDTENQNSDETEGDETSGDAATAGLSSDGKGAEGGEQPADDGANDENEVMSAAADDSIELNQDNIDEKFGRNGTPGKYILAADLTYDGTITLGQGETVINLNGHKIKHESADQPLFNITGGATLTIKDLINDSDPEKASEKVDDGQPLDDQGQDLDRANYGKEAKLVYDADGIPSSLTYYVTKSSPSATDATKTTETLFKHSVEIKGAIVACGGSERLKLINLYATGGKGGTFKLESGVITQQENTQQKNSKVSSLVYAENGSIVNMSGGYVCGASTGTSGTGAGIMVSNAGGNGSILNLTGGVIAGNYAPNGGGVYATGSTINMTNGTISGNGTFEDQPGYGAGICALGSAVTVSGGYITNNKNQYDYEVKEGTNSAHKGNGCHGGGGIAAYNGGSLQISGGCITGNYSAEAGGGVYAGNWTQPLGKFKVYGGIIASNVAEHSEGGGIRIAAPTLGEFEVPKGSHAYITNNTTNTTNDWGGGGVFVQGGNADQNVNSASLKIYNTLITNNHAEGFGGGFAACPSGKTAITDTNGIAIYDNTDNNGNHRSGGSNGKSEDWDYNKEHDKGGEITPEFINAGHKDLFLIHDSANFENNPYIAAVTGQMLGGGAANWSGTIDKTTPTSIGKYEGAQAKYMIGLKSEPIQEDMEAATAAATLYITGNKSNIHGGGIMTNGDVVAGSTTQVKVYPKMKLNGTKKLEGRDLKKNEFEFMLLKQGADKKAPSFGSDGTLQPNGCSVVNTVKNDGNGNFAFDLGEVYADADLVYYLVEVPGADKDVINYDNTIYKIDPTVVEETSKTHSVLGITYTYYKVESVSVTKVKNDGTGAKASETESAAIAAAEGENAAAITLTKGATFTNTYTSSGSWTPQVTKKVDGGEMKKFSFELADDENFTNPKTVTVDPSKAATDENDNETAPVIFATKDYKLKDLENGPKTFFYYVREKKESSTYPHYKFDQSVYRFKVVATDNTKGRIDCAVTYRKGTVDSVGKWVPDANSEDHELTATDTPTFTNTYSTSLPLSGMSGVTLTYLAGAAVLCAAAAWMHIRRKANAKGGERRE